MCRVSGLEKSKFSPPNITKDRNERTKGLNEKAF